MRKRYGLSYRCRRIQRIYPDVAEAQVDVIGPGGLGALRLQSEINAARRTKSNECVVEQGVSLQGVY